MRVLLVLLVLFAGCASPPDPPVRPVPATAEAAQCLRECEAISAICAGSAHSRSRTPVASDPWGVLFGAIADNSAANKTIESCYGTLKNCYQDCDRFPSQGGPMGAQSERLKGLEASPPSDISAADLQMLHMRATRGDAGAQFQLGRLYVQRWGGPQDYTTARQWFEQAATQGHAQAQFQLGRLYVQGKGVPQDYTTARQWFEKAAAQGHAWAQFFLGVLYAEGRGVLQDYGTARQWYERAAAQGEAMAQFNLGLLYAEGRGVPQNSVHAWMWYSLAAAHSTDDQPKLAADPRDEITRRMTPAQIAEAQRLANQCEARQFKGCRGEKTIESTR